MSNYKIDIESKLIKEKDNILKDLPEFLFTYIDEILPSRSNELRSHIAAAKDIINFLKYYSDKFLKKDINNLNLTDIDATTIRVLNSYFKYITKYTIKYKSSKGKEITRVRTNSTSSKARKLASLKKFYEYLFKNNLITHNPTADMKITRPEISKINCRLDLFEINELKREILLGENLKTSRERKAFERLKLRDITIFLLVSYTGIRVSELVSLDISDINTMNCTLKVIRKNNKIQEIPYPFEITQDIDTYLKYRINFFRKIPEEYRKALFLSQQNKRISEDSIRKLLKKYSNRLNIRNVSCHTFRRTFLSTLYNNTKDIKLVSRIGGHSISTASKYYVDVDDDRYRYEISKFSYSNDKKRY